MEIHQDVKQLRCFQFHLHGNTSRCQTTQVLPVPRAWKYIKMSNNSGASNSTCMEIHQDVKQLRCFQFHLHGNTSRCQTTQVLPIPPAWKYIKMSNNSGASNSTCMEMHQDVKQLRCFQFHLHGNTSGCQTSQVLPIPRAWKYISMLNKSGAFNNNNNNNGNMDNLLQCCKSSN